jgi:hypothetical protein
MIFSELDRYFKNNQKMVIKTFENIWEKYSLPLQMISGKKQPMEKQINEYLTNLGYFSQANID